MLINMVIIIKSRSALLAQYTELIDLILTSERALIIFQSSLASPGGVTASLWCVCVCV